MKLLKRVRRGLACTGAIATLAILPLALLAEPAAAWPPATIKICNEPVNTVHFDVDRSSTSSYGTYSNDLAPGDCTGNVNDPAKVTIDISNDGANASTVKSFQEGVNGDGIDDGNGPWDPACVESLSSAPSARTLNQTLADHAGTGGYSVKLFMTGVTKCGAENPLNGRICSDSGSFDDFDAEGIGTNTYNNNLPPGECTGWFPIASTVSGLTAPENNPNRMIADLSNDNAFETVAFKWKDNYDDTTLTACSQDFGSDVGGVAGTGWNIDIQDDGADNLVAGKTVTIKTYLGVQDPDEGICGGEMPQTDQYPNESAYGSGLPTENPFDPGSTVGNEVGTTGSDDFPESQATYPYQTMNPAANPDPNEPDGS